MAKRPLSHFDPARAVAVAADMGVDALAKIEVDLLTISRLADN
jgi:hypothetical protein